QPVKYDAALTVTKSCESKVEALNNQVVVRVDVQGTVCNAPPNPLPPGVMPEAITGISVTDNPALVNQPINVGTLKPGECVNYSSSYYPSTGAGNGAPHQQTYSDTVNASGTGQITGSNRFNTATANCPLCPAEE